MASDLHGGAVALLNSSLSALRAYAELRDLAENLRILSFNAELAANRIGGRGKTMRVLTQATRELAYQLRLLDADFARIKARVYHSSAAALKAIGRRKMLERAAGAPRPGPNEAARRGSERQLSLALTCLDDVIGTGSALAQAAAKVQEVAAKANAIMVTIAIEAAGAGGLMEQFQTIAASMRGYAATLSGMNAEANRQIAETISIGAALHMQAAKRPDDQDRESAA